MSAVDTLVYRDAMARLGAAVNIVTSGTLEQPVGFTASAVCSVTDTPPTLLVCMNRDSRSRSAFVVGGPVCVNVLSGQQQSLSAIFAGKATMEERFGHGHWGKLATGAPVLREAVASFDCEIERIVEVGTHSVMFGIVKDLRISDGLAGLVYFNRSYHILPHPGL